MRNKNVIGVLILIVGFSGSSLAGFKDALKSAAGGVLNEVTGTTLVLRDVSIQDSSFCSADDFKKDHQFSDEEYRQWLQDVIRQLKAAGWKPVPGISVDGMVADGKRAKISEDEAKNVFCTVENGGVFLAQDFAYFSAGNSFIKFNYATLAAGRCDERGDILSNSESSRVISVIENVCDSARSKIDDEKNRIKQQLADKKAVEMHRQEQEKQKLEQAQRAQAELERKAEIQKQEAILVQEREQQRKQEESRLAAEKAESDKIAAQKQEESQKQIQAILAWDDSLAKKRAADMKKKTIVFKALYLGMPGEDAYKIIYRAASRTIMSQLGGHDANDICAKGSIYVGSQDEVVSISLDAMVVNALFDSDKQDATAFVETFIKAYGIPRMEVSDDLSSWTYTSPDGAKLTIDTQKNILLEKVASKKEQKKNFD